MIINLKLSAWQDLQAMYTHVISLLMEGEEVTINDYPVRKDLNKERFVALIRKIVRENEKRFHPDVLDNLREELKRFT